MAVAPPTQLPILPLAFLPASLSWTNKILCLFISLHFLPGYSSYENKKTFTQGPVLPSCKFHGNTLALGSALGPIKPQALCSKELNLSLHNQVLFGVFVCLFTYLFIY